MAINKNVNLDLVARTISGWWDDWTLARQEREKIWDENIQNYLVTINEAAYENFPWRCRVADPASQAAADTIASNIRNSLFPINEQFFSTHALDDASFGRPAASMHTHQSRMLVAGDFIERVMPWIKQVVVIGSAPYALRWGRLRPQVKKRVRVIDPVTRDISIVVREESVGMAEGLLFECLDAYDVARDPSSLSHDASPDIRRMLVTADELTAIPNLENLEALDEELNKAPEIPSDIARRTRQNIFGLNEEAQTSEPEKIELLWYYGDAYFDGELFANQIIVLANRKHVLRMDMNPFWAGRPIGWGGYDPLWVSAYEKGALEPVRGIQHLINTFQCQKADILNLIINPNFAYVDDGIIDPDLMWMRPGGGIPMADINNLKPISANQNVALTYTELSQLELKHERSTGASRFDQGLAPGGRRTAFEANLINAGGNSRSNDVIRHMANGPLERILNFAMLSTQQFKWDGDELDQDTLVGNYYAEFTGAATTLIRQQQLNAQLLFTQLISQSPELAAAVNTRTLAQKLAKNLAMDDPDLLNSALETQRRLDALSRQTRQPANVPQSEGIPGGRDETLRSLLENVQGP